MLYLAGYWVLKYSLGYSDDLWPPLHQRPAVIYALGMLLLGGQFMSIGFLAEMFTAYYSGNVPAYSIKERTEEITGE
jgi:dolichol-phosphate mannosyltransferase